MLTPKRGGLLKKISYKGLARMLGWPLRHSLKKAIDQWPRVKQSRLALVDYKAFASLICLSCASLWHGHNNVSTADLD